MYLLLNGTLVLDSGNSKVFIEPDKYCVDGAGSHTMLFSDNNPEYPESFEIVHYGGTEIDQVVHICFSGDNVQEDNTKYDVWQLRLYASVNLVSTFFLLLTAIVYVILWEHQNIHGWLQYSYVISLLCANIFLSVVQFAPHSLQIECLVCCRIMGSLIHFSYLSAFFWLTSMNFDLFWTFRDDPQLFVITPRFGERNCYFYGEKEKLPYFYGPVGLLLTINSIFFVCTIYSLHKLQNDTKFATRQSSRQEKKRFLLFMKLFVVMGVTWIFDVISWAAEQLNPGERHFIRKIFVPTDLLIALQGVAIFVIFTCKPNTCRQLEAQFKKFSLYLQEQRDKKTDGLSLTRVRLRQVAIWICLVIIPVVNRLRELMSFCCRATRSLEGRRGLNHNSTLTSSWDKTRKASDCSVSTVVTHVDHHGSIEMDCASTPRTSTFPNGKG
ncbi:G-protein coupled receptor Mth2 [Orchesella cincta]|uniref:G-protein coupled receptor Mth2 n=1 Tax=Orchesella cincta TaxID=48709 RepID=A0A1D2N5E3_ORCCI|nr:G-protein coupled receptor Mth2 [Orchesella cincta]